MRVYYDRDADVNLIKGKKVLVVGYGSQGHAHAMNLRDSGVKDVRIALKPGSATIKKAEGAGFTVMSPADGAKWADIVMMLTPDELQSDIYVADLAPNLKQIAALAFAHGLNVHFNLLTPRPDLDVFMIAPKGPGHTVRSDYVRGGGVPCLVAVAQNPSGNALEVALSDASAIGGGRAGVIDYAALSRALRSGKLSGAVLDVFDPEPLPPSSPRWKVPNLIMTPHCSSDDLDDYLPLTLDLAFANVARLRDGRKLKNVVDRKTGY